MKTIKVLDREARLILSNISLSIILKFGSLALSLIITRQYIVYFDNNVILGGWYAIVSILNWILYFDLGIGNGMRNCIVEPLENKNYLQAKKYLSTGYLVVGLLSLFIFLIGITISIFINWNYVLNIDPKVLDINSLRIMVIISIGGVCTHFFLKVIISLYQAMRKTAVSGYTALGTNLFLILYLKTVNFENERAALIVFSIVYALATVIPVLVLTIVSYLGKLKSLRPSIKFFEPKLAKKIILLGLSFFAIQITQLFVSTADSWMITFFFQPEDAVNYQIYYRIFSIALTTYALFSQTTWSSITKYYAEQNGEKIMQEHEFLIIIAIIGSISCGVVALLFDKIVGIWMGNLFTDVSCRIALLFAAWMTIQMLINGATAVANGMGRLRCQGILYPLAAVLKVISVIYCSYKGFTWSSLIICNIISLMPLLIIQSIEVFIITNGIRSKEA